MVYIDSFVPRKSGQVMHGANCARCNSSCPGYAALQCKQQRWIIVLLLMPCLLLPLLLLLLLQDLSKLSLSELEAELARRKNAQA
jgi:hypothetical protein